MNENRFRAMNSQLIISVSALLLFAVSVQAAPVAFLDNFDGPTLDAAWTASGTASNHLGFSGGLYSMTSDKDTPPESTKIRRNTGGTVGDFTATIQIQADPFHDPNNTSADFKWKFFGGDGFVELVWNGSDHARVFHNNFSVGGGTNLVTNFDTGFVDGDSIEFTMTYMSSADTLSVDYSIAGGSSGTIYSGGTTQAGGFADFYLNATELEVFQFGAGNANDPIISIDSYSLTAVAVPEPGSFAMVIPGLFLLGRRRRRTLPQCLGSDPRS